MTSYIIPQVKHLTVSPKRSEHLWYLTVVNRQYIIVTEEVWEGHWYTILNTINYSDFSGLIAGFDLVLKNLAGDRPALETK